MQVITTLLFTAMLSSNSTESLIAEQTVDINAAISIQHAQLTQQLYRQVTQQATRALFDTQLQLVHTPLARAYAHVEAAEEQQVTVAKLEGAD